MRRYHSEIPFVVGLLVLLFLSSLMIIMLSLKSYLSIHDDLETSQNIRTSLAYMEEKAKQMDEDGAISLGAIQDKDGQEIKALVIGQTLEEESFLTYIYSYDGYLKEYFVREGSQVYAEDGNSLTEVEKMTMDTLETENGETLISVIIEDGQGSQKLYIHPATVNEEVAP